MSKLEEIRERWRDRSWPKIGYFVHGDALMDIDALLAIASELERDAARYRWIRSAQYPDPGWNVELVPTLIEEELDAGIDAALALTRS